MAIATNQRTRDSRCQWLSTALLILLSGGLYVATLAPTVTAEDSGELIAAAYTFGIPHPPGYPLWTMLCGLFIKIVPIGEIAYRANLFSAVCASLSTVPIFFALLALGIRRLPAFTASLIWACTGTLWSQSVITEVYSLNALFCTLLIYTAIKWHVTKKNRWLIWASFVFGLGMCNQHTIGFVALAVGGWILSRKPVLLKDWRLIAKCAAVFTLALTPYLYLPVRAQSNPAMNWGNPASLNAFGNHVSRSQYGSTAPLRVVEDRSVKRLARQVQYVAGGVADDMTAPLACLAILGIGLQLWRRDPTASLSILVILSSGLLFLFVSNIGLDRTFRHAMRVFFIPLSLSLVIPLAYLFDQLLMWTYLRRSFFGFVIACIVLATPLLPAFSNYSRCDYSDYWYAHDHANNILASAIPNAIIFPSSDHNTFPLLYLTMVENQRPDVTIADKYGYVDPAVLDSLKPETSQRMEGLPDQVKHTWIIEHAHRPVYVTTRVRSPVLNADYVSVGLLYHLLPHGKPLDRDAPWRKIHYRNINDDISASDLGADHILADYHFFLALDYLRRGYTDRALEEFSLCAQRLHGIKEAFNNIGSALAEHGLLKQAMSYFQHAIQLDMRYQSPKRNLEKVKAQLMQEDGSN